jgi:DNA-binding transcriptional ArsR family regulator
MGHRTNWKTPRAQLDSTAAEAVAETLSALTTPSRLLILGRLRQGASRVSDLCGDIGMEQSAVSHQLRLLRTLGLVKRQRTGRSVVYSLYDHHVASLLDEAVYHAEHVRLGAPDRVSNAMEVPDVV